MLGMRARFPLASVLLVASLASLASSPTALARAPRDASVPLDTAARANATAARGVTLPFRAQTLGVSWRAGALADGALQLRTRTRPGAWSSWRDVERADVGRVSEPSWVGGADQVQLRGRALAQLRGVRIVAIDGGSDSSARIGRDVARSEPIVGTIQLRGAWGAAAPKSAPALADAVRGVVIHHTDNANGYACSQVPQMLRGIQRYHMVTQGWNDIGYNFVIDRCGGVWEGRDGGVDQSVIGAHTYGFNTRTSGIALLGDHSTARPSARARLALRRLVAWRLDVAHVKPNSKMQLVAAASAKFKAGSTVRVRAVSGHRDLYPTACPGAAEYADLDALAAQAWRTGGAKIANVAASYQLRSSSTPTHASVHSVAVSLVTPWVAQRTTIRLERASTGETLGSRSGRGLTRRASFALADDVDVPPWDVVVVATAATPSGSRAREARVMLQDAGADPGLAITTVPASTITPNGDGVDDDITLAYTLALDYRLQVELLDPAHASRVALLQSARYVGVTGDTPRELRLAIPTGVAAGSYVLRASLPADTAAGRSVRDLPITIAR